MKRGGIYLHIPYCRKKCLYCDFFSGGLSVADWEGLRISLLNELEERFQEVPEEVVSIYFGGGTPSSMPPGDFATLLEGIRMLSGARMSASPEITIEVNPEDVTEEKADIWKRSGVNRVSLGIQSFDDEVLKTVGRCHSGDSAERAFRILSDRFQNISADLIFGLPGQTLDCCRDDVRRIIDLRPTHISAYSLMYEPGTALTVLKDSGRIVPVGEEETLAMFDCFSEELASAGYIRYEISNYSLPGFESRHNSLYWHGAPYLGLGPSAHSYDGERIRRSNPWDIRGYLSRFRNGQGEWEGEVFYSEETLGDEELREEYLLTRLRMKEGFLISDFRERFGEKSGNEILRRAETLAARGAVMIDDGRIALTPGGIMLADSVILELAME